MWMDLFCPVSGKSMCLNTWASYMVTLKFWEQAFFNETFVVICIETMWLTFNRPMNFF